MSETKQNRYRAVQFLTSAHRLDQAPPDTGYEVAFAGRSNAGKSSALNAITESKGLARTSKTPGRTQLINFFTVDEQRRLVDLPGYGYAKVPVEVKRHWQATLERYLAERQCLRGLVLLMDVRHPLKDFDRMMLQWCAAAHMPVHVLLTKCDKLNRGPASAVLQQVRREMKREFANATVQLFSALKGQGVEEARAQLDRWFQFEGAAPAEEPSGG